MSKEKDEKLEEEQIQVEPQDQQEEIKNEEVQKELSQEESQEEQPQEPIINTYDEEEIDNSKGLKRLFKKLGKKISALWNKILRSKFAVGVEKVLKVIGKVFMYIFYPIVLFKRKVFDKMTHGHQKFFVAMLFLLPVILGFLIFYLYPLILSLVYAFSTVSVQKEGGLLVMFGQHQVDGVWVKDLFYNFKELFTGPTGMLPVKNATSGIDEKISLLQALLQTSGQTILNTVVITIFSLLVAVMLNGKFKGRGIVRAIFFLPVILNSEAIAAATESTQAIDQMLNSVGSNALTNIFDMKMFMTSIGVPAKMVTFLNSITSTIYSTISYAGIQILIFLAAIQSVPQHLYEAAKIEGATKYEEFWKITLPMVSPMILTVVVYTVVDSFLRSDLNKYVQQLAKNPLYGFHAAASWCYIFVSLAILGIAMLVLRKVVFYYDER